MTDIDLYQPPAAVEQYQARLAMTPEAAKALDDQLTQCIRAILREGTDYGVIPGTGGEKSLWRPGAQKLLQWFGLGFTCERVEVERDDDNRKHGITYRCTVFRQGAHDQRIILSTCEGTADYDETKFYKAAEQVQREAEARERMWAEKDRRVANPNKWNQLTEYRAPWNTLMKRAQKRAIVGAALDATAAGGRFNQEREEDDHGPVPHDDGPTWYEQALEEALTFTDTARGSKLYTEAAQAARDGLCTPGQANHVQNRVKQRLKLLATAKPVDVEDLARQAATAAGEERPPAETPSDEAAKQEALASGESAEYGTERHQKLIGIVWQHLGRLGYPAKNKETDEESRQRLADIAKLAGISEISSTSDLDTGELSRVADMLARCKNRAALNTLLETGEGDG